MHIAGGGLAALLFLPSLGFAQSLGSAASFAVLAGNSITFTGAVTILGSVGVSPGNQINGLPSGQPIGGTVHNDDAVAAQAETDLAAAAAALDGMTCGTSLSGQDLGGMTLVPGVYCFQNNAALTGSLTLDGQGNANAVWVFQIGTKFSTAMNAIVNLTNAAQNTNVYWRVGDQATFGSGTVFLGNIVSEGAIAFNTSATLNGRALARHGAVTMDTNFVGDPSTPTLASTWGTMKIRYR
jgi:type VI secretion system secreted protein VgrG